MRKITLIILILMCVIYAPPEFVSLIIEVNLSLSEKWYGLYIIYLIEIYFFILLLGLVLLFLSDIGKLFYTKLTERYIRKRWLLIILIRFYYEFKKINYHCKLIYTRYSKGRENELFDQLTASICTDFIKSCFNMITSTFSLLAVVFTLMTIDQSFIYFVIESIRDHLDNVSLSFVLWDIISKLSSIVIFVLIIFMLFFVSSYGVRRRAIAQANKKKLEEVIQLFRKLEEPVLKIVYEGSKNLQYALNCYDSMIDTLKEFKTHSAVNEQLPASLRRINFNDYPLFKDITELDKLIKILEELHNSENIKFASWFSQYRFELREFYIITKFEKLDDYERLLFTKNSFGKLPNVKHNQHLNTVDEQTLKEEFEFKQYLLNKNIIEGLELLYTFYRYIEVSNKILHIDSDRLGRGIRLFTGKE